MDTFEQGLKILSGVNQVEMILMRDLYKTVNDFKLKAPILNSTERRKMEDDNLNKSNKKNVIDEHAWLWETYCRLRETFQHAMNPAIEWLQLLQSYKSEIALIPDNYIEVNYGLVITQINSQVPYNDMLPSTEYSEITFDLVNIKCDIAEMDEKIKDLDSEIPDEMNLGVIKIDCRKVKKNLIDKREKIKERLQYIISLVIKFNIEEIKKEKLKIITRLK